MSDATAGSNIAFDASLSRPRSMSLLSELPLLSVLATVITSTLFTLQKQNFISLTAILIKNLTNQLIQSSNFY